MIEKAIKAEPLTAEGFKPFGDVIEINDNCQKFIINYGSTTRFHDLASVDVEEQGGKAIISLLNAMPMQDDFSIQVMERHPLSSQAFIPLEGQSYLVVVAAAGDFDPDNLNAFVASSSQGVNYARGTWHHYCLPLGVTSNFLVVDRGGKGKNLEEVSFEGMGNYRVQL